MSAPLRISHYVAVSALLTLTLSSISMGCSESNDPSGGDNTASGGATGGTLNPGSGGSVPSGGTASGGTASGGAGAASGGTASGGSLGSGGADGGAGTGGQQMGTGSTGGSSGGATSSGGSTSGIDDYNDEFVEFVGEDCELPEPMLLSSADHSLPDPFLMGDGSRMSSVSQWACQRAWLKKSVETFVHGAKPGRPEVVTGSVSAMSIQVHVENGGSSTDFSLGVSLPPNATSTVPAMFRTDSGGVPTNFLHGEGVAVITVTHSAAESAYNQVYGSGGVSNQIKWAWYVSRAIDVLVDERDNGSNDIIDPTGLGTTGCSYAGKSAFTVGAFDERIALGIPMESGTGGLASYRVIADNDIAPNQGENNPEQLSEVCGGANSGWFSSQFCSTYRNQVDSLPVDAHFLAAMYAPRGFTTLDNNRIGHLGPVAQFAAVSAAAEVFKALGVEKNVGYHGGNDGDPHNHCTFNPSQEETARKAIQAFLTKKIEPDNFMEPKLVNQADQPVNFSMSNYVDWETPTLD